jgi:uncharacterized protein with HEPN domain
MRPDEKDITYVWDMVSACKEIRDFTRDSGWEGFSSDRKLMLAIERSLEIIGEAAGRLSGAFRDGHPEIPWHKIRGMRNILAHDYGQVDYEIVYRTAMEEIPDLLGKLERILPEE